MQKHTLARINRSRSISEDPQTARLSVQQQERYSQLKAQTEKVSQLKHHRAASHTVSSRRI